MQYTLILEDRKMIQFSASTSDEVKNRFKCPVCLGFVKVPKVTPCQHVFCQSCIKSWLKTSSSCPFCRQEIILDQLKRPSRGFYIDRSQVLVQCTFSTNGCPEEMELSELDKHEKVCKFKGPQCHFPCCKRPLENPDEPGNKKRFCCNGCLEEHLINLKLQAYKKLDWRDVLMSYENCSSVETEGEFYRKFMIDLIEKQESSFQKIKRKMRSQIPGADANVDLEETYDKQLNFTKRMLDIVALKFNKERPNIGLKMGVADRIRRFVVLGYHYNSKFQRRYVMPCIYTYYMKA